MHVSCGGEKSTKCTSTAVKYSSRSTGSTRLSLLANDVLVSATSVPINYTFLNHLHAGNFFFNPFFPPGNTRKSKNLHLKTPYENDYGGAEPFFHLLGRTLSEHDKLYIKESATHCEYFPLKLLSTK